MNIDSAKKQLEWVLEHKVDSDDLAGFLHLDPQNFERTVRLVEDRELVLPETFATEDDEAPEPQVLVLSSGEVTPFEARISFDPDVGEHILTAELTGATEIIRRGYD